MPVTKQGPASITVTRSTRPSSGLKTCVMPTFLPSRPAIALHQLDLDVDARGKVVEPLERVDRLRRWLEDVDQPLVRADLEVLARVLVLERAADHAVDVLLGGQRHRPRDARARAHGRVHDLLGGRLDRRVVVGLQPDTDLVLSERRHGLGHTRGRVDTSPAPASCLCRRGPYCSIEVTTPEPTVRPPSRTAKRRPSSMAIGWISSTVICVLSPGLTISCPSGSVISPVTSVVRK